jgi:hypothetical protein
MKQFIFTTLLTATILFSTQRSFGKNTRTDTTKSLVCLEVIGIALDENNEPLNGVEVRLYKENDELEWSEITNVMYHEHRFLFNLEADEYYTIEITKPGYVKRLIGISTQLPANVSYKQIFHHEFEVTLLKEKAGLDDYYLDFPVALIRYDKTRDVFDNSYVYTNHIKTKMKEPVNVDNFNVKK